MKKLLALFFCQFFILFHGSSQQLQLNSQDKKEIAALIDQYSLAREKSDTVLLKNILTADIDQLVSTGEWRSGIRSAVDGMLKSSGSRPGTRTLTITNCRPLGADAAIVDCKYEIENEDGSLRKMWSTFLVVREKSAWKIAAIRNMLPSK